MQGCQSSSGIIDLGLLASQFLLQKDMKNLETELCSHFKTDDASPFFPRPFTAHTSVSAQQSLWRRRPCSASYARLNIHSNRTICDDGRFSKFDMNNEVRRFDLMDMRSTECLGQSFDKRDGATGRDRLFDSTSLSEEAYVTESKPDAAIFGDNLVDHL